MRYYSYNEYKTEPGVDDYVETVSEEYIRQSYYPYWRERMIAKYGEDYVAKNYCFEDCLDYWMFLNWAWEVKDE